MDADPPAKEACGNDARVVQDEEFIAAEQVGKFRKKPVVEAASGARKQEKSRSIAPVEGPLGDLALREVVVEVSKAHQGGV